MGGTSEVAHQVISTVLQLVALGGLLGGLFALIAALTRKRRRT